MAVAPITSIKGIGPRRAEAFGRLGLSVEDMLSFMPRGYIDYTKSVLMCEAEQGMLCAVKVTITGEAKNRANTRRAYNNHSCGNGRAE